MSTSAETNLYVIKDQLIVVTDYMVIPEGKHFRDLRGLRLDSVEKVVNTTNLSSTDFEELTKYRTAHFQKNIGVNQQGIKLKGFRDKGFLSLGTPLEETYRIYPRFDLSSAEWGEDFLAHKHFVTESLAAQEQLYTLFKKFEGKKITF